MKQLPAMPPHIQEKFEEEIRVEIIRQQTEEDLKSNPVYQEFFTQFNPSSVDSFIRHYARRKAYYLTRGKDYINQEEQESFRYKLFAQECLWAIQQKKLFNLQCQWRAEQVRLKGVDHTTQFLLLSSNIQHCPYISPVSRAEMEMYVKYLRSGNAQLIVSYDNWQDYEGFKAEYDSERIPSIDDERDDSVPAWYRFYDEYMATHLLMELPDVRGEKEQRYRSIARQRQLDQMKRSIQQKTMDDRPYLSVYDTEVVESFVRKFEDKSLLKFCRAVEAFQQQMDEQMELDEALETLRSADKKVSVKSNSDWKEAVINAAKQFELEQVAEILPTVHQEYVIRVENGINFPQSIIDKKREEYAFQLCETAKQQILEGRRFLGEPDNLNF
jgi:hypothetical protein